MEFMGCMHGWMDLMGLEGTLCFLCTLEIALNFMNGIAGFNRSLVGWDRIPWRGVSSLHSRSMIFFISR
jgi:hypothetical protein